MVTRLVPNVSPADTIVGVWRDKVRRRKESLDLVQVENR